MTATVQRVSQALRHSVLTALRTGQREVSWVPDWMGLGNALYQWLWAYEGQQHGRARMALVNASVPAFLPVFPAARTRVLLTRNEVRVRDNRVRPWEPTEPTHDEQAVPGAYDPPLLSSFIRELLLPGSGIAPSVDDALVVNVRRGDYYSVPRHRREFGFDVAGFVASAITSSIDAAGAPERIHVVSDGIPWCRDELGFLTDVAPVTFADPGDPVADLRAVAAARRVILTNSTFSYWAGYLGDELYAGDSSRQVVVPAFFRRSSPRGRSHLLRPSWTVLDVGSTEPETAMLEHA